MRQYQVRKRGKTWKQKDAVAVSLTLPLREEPYETTILFPFFDGLIPEGWLLGVVCRNWKIDRNDRFGLLLSACKDCIGDVCIRGTERTGKDTGAGTNGCVLLAKL